MLRRLLLFPCFAATVLVTSLGAQTPPTWEVTFENDVFAGTDQHYTNGVEIEAVRYEVDEAPWWGRAVTRRILESGSFCALGCQINKGWAVTHTIYTPRDLTVEDLIPSDRPYAAWLRYTSVFEAVNDRQAHSFRGSIGLVGEAALGDEIQSGVHELINSEEPKGWDNQLDNEPILQLTYRYRYRPFEVFADEDRTNRIFDVFPHATATLGNAFAYGGLGGTLRVGYNLSRNHPSGPVPTAPDGRKSTGWEIYGFVGTEGRAVGRNIFLDGNTFEDSHEVDKKTFVWDLEAGVSLRIRRWTVTYRLIQRSREFDLQNDDQNFGSLTVTVAPF